MSLIAVERMEGLDSLAIVRLDRPEQRNALSLDMLEGLTTVFDDLAEGIEAFRERRKPRFKGT